MRTTRNPQGRAEHRAQARATNNRRAEREAKATLRDERALHDMPADIHTWATTPSWDDVELFFNQTCREAP